MPVLTPTEFLAPTPTAAPSNSAADTREAAERILAEETTDEGIVETGRRTLTPNHETNYMFTYEQKVAAIDLNFAWTLADDPRKALEIARNTREVNQAKDAIKALEEVSKILLKFTTAKKQETNLVTYIYLLFQARKQATSSNWADELPDIDVQEVPPPRATRFPPPTPPRTQGFAPSSSNRGGQASKGKAPVNSTGARPKTKGAPATTVTPPEPTGIDQTIPKLAQVQQAIELHTDSHGVQPEGEVEKLNQYIADADNRAPEPEEVRDYTLSQMMPRDQEDQTNRNPNMIANVEGKKHCVDFVLMMDVRKMLPNGKIQGMTLPDKQTFEDCVGEAINLIVSENLGWCNVVEDTWFNRHQI